jgi:hypothetical protein
MFSQEFKAALGTFHGVWAATDLLVDYAICQFLNITAEQAHMVTSGMMFGTKARLLADLVRRSDHPNRTKLLQSFKIVRGSNKRDIIAHGHMLTSEDEVTFVERPRGGDKPMAIEHSFTLEEFILHAKILAIASNDFQTALGVTDSDLTEFLVAALNLSHKSTTSPASPTSRR